MGVSRRDFLKVSLGSAISIGTSKAFSDHGENIEIPKRKFGRHPDELSVVGFGGHTLYLSGSQKDANEITHTAIDHGINFFENAWDYHEGEAEVYMGKALHGKRDKVFLMSKFCIYHSSSWFSRYWPNKLGAMKMLEDSLRRLKTDHLDLWMLHNIKGDDAVKAYEYYGAIEALEEAKKQGKIRYTGFTGHTNPQIHKDIIEGGYAWDATLMPVSVVGALKSREFEKEVMPLCVKKNIAVLGMKGFGGNRRTSLHAKTNVKEVIRYSLSYPQVCTHVIGIDKLEYARQAIAASSATPMSVPERNAAQAIHLTDIDDEIAMNHGGCLYESGCCQGNHQQNEDLTS